MTKVRGRVKWKNVKRSYGTYSYPEIRLEGIDDSIKKLLQEQDEIILDLSNPFVSRPPLNPRNRRSMRNK